MAKTKQAIIKITEEVIVEKIHIIRGIKIMLDRDLSEMYNVETRVLKQAVKRNIIRFPEDFMFEMTPEEFKNWRSQFVTSNSDKMGLRYPPFCFTEQGVAMLSSILNSETAIAVNIQIIRVFTKMKQLLLDNKELLLKIEKIERKLIGHDEDLEKVFKILKKLIQEPTPKRETVGFPYPNKK
jgi:hypothetical protein